MTTRRDFLRTTAAAALFPVIPCNNTEPGLTAFLYRTACTEVGPVGYPLIDTTACNPNPQPYCMPVEDHISLFLRGDYANVYVCRIFTRPYHLSLKQLRRYIRAMELGVTEIRISLFADNYPNLRFDFGTNYKFIGAKWMPSHIDPLDDYDLKALMAQNPNMGWTLDTVGFKCKLHDIKVTTFELDLYPVKKVNNGCWWLKYTETPVSLMDALHTYFETSLISP